MTDDKQKILDPASKGAQTDFEARMSYTDYLDLDKVLSAQNPKTRMHDEFLFIIQHQTSELWMRLAIHELDAVRRKLAKDQFHQVFKMLSRVAKVFEQLNSAWDVLRTMTPSEYSAFREELGQSSGFQSYQYRLIEFIVGNRNRAMLKPHRHRPDLVAKLERELAEPSLYQHVIYSLERSGFDLDRELLQAEQSATHVYNQSLENVWQQIYQNTERYWTYYELGEKLVDFEDYFRRWRFNHVTTVERVIGFKRGTGGTAGISYLKKMLEIELFPELWRVRTAL